MAQLSGISVEALRSALAEVDRKKPTQRLTAAIAYKNGVTQTEIATWFDVERRTIYNWFQRLDERPLEAAVRNDARSGRPRKLSASEQARLEAALSAPPADVGFDAPAWTPALVRRYVAGSFDVEYSVPSCRRLMKEAGLRYRPPAGCGGTDGNDCEADGRWVPVDSG